MYYVEMLRAWRVMRIFLIILGVVFVLAVVGRLFGHGSMNVSDYPVPKTAYNIQHTVAADGAKITSYDETGGKHVVQRTSADGSQMIAITEPSSGRTRHTSRANVGVMSITQSKHGRMTTTVIRDHAIPLGIVFVIAAVFAAIFTSILGLALSRENDGHLELAWTKPISREGYAAAIIAVDICAMLVLAATAAGLIFAILAMFGLAGKLAAGPQTFDAIALSVLYMLAFYALTMAATASVRRGGAVLGIIWPAALFFPGLTTIRWLNIGAFVRVLDTLNPVAYLSQLSVGASSESARMLTLVPPGTGYAIAAMALITIGGLVASLLQWRRLEA